MDYTNNLPSPLSSLGNFGPLNFDLSPSMLWGGLALLAVVLGFVTIVLYYHWMRYAFGNKMVLLAQILYTLVTIGGLIVMASAINYYA